MRLLLRRLWMLWRISPISAGEYVALTGRPVADQHAWIEAQYPGGPPRRSP